MPHPKCGWSDRKMQKPVRYEDLRPCSHATQNITSKQYSWIFHISMMQISGLVTVKMDMTIISANK
uniref:Ovule protein n=1 Tax=Heterorhabditis bacteriophora TaxID=37862 RepID=A0A1I7WFU7_HETBA